MSGGIDRGTVPLKETVRTFVIGLKAEVLEFEPQGGSTHSAFAPHTRYCTYDDCDNLCEDVSLEAHTRLQESNWELSEHQFDDDYDDGMEYDADA